MRKIILATLLSALSLEAFAEESKTIDVIDARQAYYQILEYNMLSLGSMASGAVAYDAEQVKIYVDNLLTMEQYGTISLYPLKTSTDDFPDRTRALPNIWTNFASVAEKGQALNKALINLEAKGGDGSEALGAALGQVGAACMSCHQSHVAN